MKYVLDANAVIGLLSGRTPLAMRVRRHRPDAFGLPAIVAHELLFGACKGSKRSENLAKIEAIPFEILPFDREDAQQAAEIRAALAASGTPIGPYDILIAGQARARDLTLVTHNTREFSRVSGLRLEDWDEPL